MNRNGDATQQGRVPAPFREHPGTTSGVSDSHTAEPCLIRYALNHVLSIAPAVLNEHGYEDIHFDEVGNTVQARDADTVITLTAWARSQDQCSVEITSQLTPGSSLGQGPNLRRAERLGEDLAEAAAAMFQDHGRSGNRNISVPKFAAEPERQVQGEKVFIPGILNDTDDPEQQRQEAQATTEAAVQQTDATATAPPGWYTDPWDPVMLRWFDGSEWTGYTQKPQPGQPA